MTFLKSIWADLVEKRLWPFALALLLALVAVPIALGGGGGGDAAPLGATGPTGAAAGQLAQVSLDADTPERRDRLGKVRDPFKQRAVPATGTSGATGAVGTTGSAGAAPAPATGTSGGGGSTAPTPTTPQDTTPAPKPAAPKPTYTTTVRLARVTAKDRPARKVEQLTPLPSTDNPFLVYLGVLSNGRTAVFLLSSDVTSEGDGACKPRRSSCETLEVDKGEVEVLSVKDDAGNVKRYQLDVVAVERTGTSTQQTGALAVKKPAGTSATKVGSGGELGTDDYEVDESTGLLTRVKKTAGLGAHVPAASKGKAAEAKALASLRAWLPASAPEGLDPMPVFLAG